MRATIDTWTGGLGLIAGFCAIAAWLAIAGRPADAPSPPASIRLGTLATGELAISPIGKPVLESDALRPGGRGETGAVEIRNETPRTLDVAVRTSAIQKELDGSGWIAVTDDGRPVVRTPLARAQAWSKRPVRLAPGEERELSARVWIPAGARDGWQAARGDLTLEFRGEAVGR
jgi:hypothetical protein